MRSINSIKNSAAAMASKFISVVIGIVAQALFLKILGDEYSGINGLFTTIITMLSIVELGFGSAIIFNLYKPVHDNDKEAIKSLMLFYRRTYHIVAICVFILGMAVLPFIGYIVGEVSIPDNLYFIFFLYVIDVVASYFVSYKRSILYAYQKTYITNLIHIGYMVIVNTIQICMLVVYRNFLLYLCINIISRILENLVITAFANRMYPFICEKDVKPLDPVIKSDIITKVKGLLFHKISSFIVLGTDNIIISMLLGIKMVAIYTNYKMIINSLNDLLNQMFSSITASVGNLLVEKNDSHNYTVFRRLYLLNSWITMWTTCCLFCIASPFIEFVYGAKYVVPVMILLIFCMNFYMTGMRRVYAIFKEAAGIFHEDRYVPVIEATINIIASVVIVVFLKKVSLLWGLGGVFIGTIISSLVLFMYSFPKYVYRNIFKRPTAFYARELIGHSLIAWATIMFTFVITTFVTIDNLFLRIIVVGIICCIIPNIIYLFIFGGREDFKYYIDMVKFMFNRRKEKN